MPQLSNSKVRTMLLALAAGAIAALVVGFFTPANATPHSNDSQPAVAQLGINSATCEAPYVEVSGITRDSYGVSLLIKESESSYVIVDNDSVQVTLNQQVVETYNAGLTTKPGGQFVIRVLPPGDTEYVLAIHSLRDSSKSIQVEFASSTPECGGEWL